MALDRLSLSSGIYRPQWDRHSSATASGSDGLQCDGDPLANADTHCRKGLLSRFQLQHGRAGDPGPLHAKRMSKTDRAAVGVHPRIVVCDAQIAQGGKAL